MGNIFGIDINHARFCNADGSICRPAPWAALAREGKPKGLRYIRIKATQGAGGPGRAWMAKNFGPARDALGSVGTYHWLDSQDGGPSAKVQADTFLLAIKHAGGLERDDVHPWVDVEAEPGTHSAAHVGALLGEFADRVSHALGRPVGLYAKSFLMALGMKGLYGCGYNATAGYADRITTHLAAIGLDRPQVWEWQYTNGSANHTTFPTVFSPTFGGHDASVFMGASLAESTDEQAWRRRLTLGGGPPIASLAVAAAVGLALLPHAIG